jgi:hypothetical protein
VAGAGRDRLRVPLGYLAWDGDDEGALLQELKLYGIAFGEIFRF